MFGIVKWQTVEYKNERATRLSFILHTHTIHGEKDTTNIIHMFYVYVSFDCFFTAVHPIHLFMELAQSICTCIVLIIPRTGLVDRINYLDGDTRIHSYIYLYTYRRCLNWAIFTMTDFSRILSSLMLMYILLFGI